MIDSLGVYDMPEDAYHADPVMGGSLSSTGARKLLPPSSPALFRHWLDHGQEPRREFDLGHAAHAEVLGVGAPVEVLKFKDRRAAGYKAAEKAARDGGAVPILEHEHRAVLAMAAAVRAHPIAGRLLAPDAGPAEQVLVWPDVESGVWCRARLDKQTRLADGRLCIVDLKTTACAEPGAVGRSVDSYGYYLQDAFYSAGAAAVGLDDAPAFLFVFVEKTPPHPVTVVQLDSEAREWGQVLTRKACDVYRQCTETGVWPGYTDQIETVSLPAYTANQHAAAWARGDYDTAADLREDRTA